MMEKGQNDVTVLTLNMEEGGHEQWKEGSL